MLNTRTFLDEVEPKKCLEHCCAGKKKFVHKRAQFSLCLDTNVPFLPRELIRGKRSGGGVKEKEGWGEKGDYR